MKLTELENCLWPSRSNSVIKYFSLFVPNIHEPLLIPTEVIDGINYALDVTGTALLQDIVQQGRILRSHFYVP